MRTPLHNTGKNLKSEHGTTRSYVIGFVLSLLCTFIAYSLVVNKIISGNTLQATIIGLAMLQLLVQILFFLHLGRGPKPNWNLFFFVSTFAIVLVVVGGSIFIINNLHYNMSPSDKIKKLVNDEGIYQVGGEKTGACQGQHDSFKVTIKNGLINPLHTVANKCDTLTFINEDNEQKEITFGTHLHHEVYAGETELMVRKGRSKSITLSETGTYQYHDHLHPEVIGYISVNPTQHFK